jgi:hypothetical protein
MFTCWHGCPRCHRDHSHEIVNPGIQLCPFRTYCVNCAANEAAQITALGNGNERGEAATRTPRRNGNMETPQGTITENDLPEGRHQSSPHVPAIEKEDWSKIVSYQVAREETLF